MTIGNSAPTQPTVDVTPDAPATEDALSVSASGSTDPDGDPVSYSYRWYRDGELQAAYNDETAVPASATEKGQVWRCVVTPSDGSATGPSGEDQVTIGNSPPTVQEVAISPDPARAGDTLTATPSGWSDPDGDVAGYRWQWRRWSNEQWQDIAGATDSTLDGTAVEVGDRIQVVCTPWDGAAEGAPVTAEIVISDAPPEVSIEAPADGSSSAQRTIEVTGSAGDDSAVDRVEVRVNGGEWFAATGTTAWSASVGLQPGANAIEARSRDDAGQWSEIAGVTVTCTADFLPRTAITSPEDGTLVRDVSVRVAGTAWDDRGLAKVVVRVNGGAWYQATGTGSWSAWVTLGSGDNLIEARARDSAGQWGPIVAITLVGYGDLRPVTWITWPEDGTAVRNASVAVGGTARDDGGLAKIVVRVNGGAWHQATGTDSWSTWVNLRSGDNLIEARARDSAGQWGPIVQLWLTGMGDLRPVVRFTSPADGTTVATDTIEVFGVGYDDRALTRVIVRVNGGGWFKAQGTASWNSTVQLAEGVNLIEARGYDNAKQWGPIVAITVTRSGGYALALSSLSAQPTTIGAQVVFALSTSGSVSAEVMNIAGRPIRTLVTDRAMPAGVNELWWDGRSEAGLKVPNGTYLVRLTARDASGAQCTAVTTLQIMR